MFGPVRMIIRASLGEPQVVRDELVARHHPLDDRMPPADDLEIELVGHRRTHVALARRDVGERAQHVELGDRARDALQPRDLAARSRAQRLEQLALARLDPLGRGEHALLVLLERRRDEALARS